MSLHSSRWFSSCYEYILVSFLIISYTGSNTPFGNVNRKLAHRSGTGFIILLKSLGCECGMCFISGQLQVQIF